MKSVCFACGHEKPEPLKICKRCEVKPVSQKDKTSSICLSDSCLKPEALLKGSRYIREKRILPKFAEKIMAKATGIVEELMESEEQYTQMGVDDSYFDFKGFPDKRGEIVRVHSIGKPIKEKAHQTTGISHLGSDKNTYQVIEWEVGKDISFDDCDSHVDDKGELYVQFTWVGDNGWTWKHVSKSHFEQMKMLDSMRGQ